MRSFFISCAALLLVGCAHSGPRFDRAANLEKAAADPWEYDNRQMYDLNKAIDRNALRPTAQVYRGILPRPARNGLHNFFQLTGEPSNALNAVLQGKPKRAFRAIDRLFINTLLGLTVMDPASKMGLERQRNDFGQTLAVWGVGSGPFFMMPIMGPTTTRDGFGVVVDFFLDPLNLLEWAYLSPTERYAKRAVQIIDTRANLIDQGEQMLEGAVDEYATIRSAWLQLRRYQLYDGNPPPLPFEEEDDIAPYPEDLPPPTIDTPLTVPADADGGAGN